MAVGIKSMIQKKENEKVKKISQIFSQMLEEITKILTKAITFH